MEFRIGGVFDQTLSLIRARPVTFMVLGAIPTLAPYLSIFAFSLIRGFANPRLALLIFLLCFVLIEIGVNILAQAAIVYSAFRQMQGAPCTIGTALGRSVKRIVPLTAAVIVFVVIWIIGSILLVIPGVIAFVTFYVVSPVCTVDGLGPIDSLRRSARLTKGYRWPIFGLLLLTFIAAIVLGVIMLIFIRLVPSLAILFNFFFQAFVYAFIVIKATVTYHRLCVIKEGFTLNVAGVFD